jgi:hypothetical protein
MTVFHACTYADRPPARKRPHGLCGLSFHARGPRSTRISHGGHTSYSPRSPRTTASSAHASSARPPTPVTCALFPWLDGPTLTRLVRRPQLNSDVDGNCVLSCHNGLAGPFPRLRLLPHKRSKSARNNPRHTRAPPLSASTTPAANIERTWLRPRLQRVRDDSAQCRMLLRMSR